MSKNLNVNLKFNADTSNAKAQLQQLQTQLSNLAVSTSIGGKLTAEMQQGINAAAQLKQTLMEATNVNTGKLDLGKFNQQLKRSGMSIKQYATQLQALGPQGTQAFMSLARSISSAELPIVRLSSKVRALGQTLANTLRWQISSSALMGVTNAISTAYDYAQDLNKSLNNIRIVTGLSAEEMDKFAAKANKAAKALSTSTTAYTDAALIYYQQGLKGKDVENRTDTTIKLANVTGESAQTVSEWMTAIWNNFDDGSKSLETYADVLAKLGAATASSADEIAGGLEKFAAVAETVGLSYEYAASALATITATTRQSEDVVGTALKTLFARIQDLDLGKTLEDGTDLGAYSQALAKVGVNIKTSTGDLKEMNTILDEMGQVWKTIDQDQQVALAKSVAGIRQYTQLIALMENYDYFKQNAQMAEASAGALQDQADIYEESWQAASKRVQASLESVYSSLIEDDFFIDILNGLEDIIGFVDELIESMGGLPGVLSVVSTLMFNIFGSSMVKGLDNMVLSLQSLTKNGRAKQMATKQEAWSAVRETTNQTMHGQSGEATMSAFRREAEVQKSIYENQQNITSEQQKNFQIRLEALQIVEQENIKLAEQLELLEQAGMKFKGKFQQAEMISPDKIVKTDKNGKNFYEKSGLAKKSEEYGKIRAELNSNKQWTKEEAIKRFGEDFVDKRNFDKSGKLTEIGKENILNNYAKDLNNLKKEISAANGYTEEQSKIMDDYSNNLVESAEKTKMFNTQNDNLEQSFDKLNEDILNSKKGVASWSQGFVAAAQGISTMSMGINMILGAIDQVNSMIKEGEFSFSGFLSVLTSIGMAFPMIVTSFTQMKEVLNTETLATWANTLAKLANAKATDSADKESKERLAALVSEKKLIKDMSEEELKLFAIREMTNNQTGQTEYVQGLKHKRGGKKTQVVDGNTWGDDVLAQNKGKLPTDGAAGGGIGFSFKSILGSLGKILKAIWPILGVVIAISVTAWLINKANNKHIENLKKTKEQAKRMKEEYDKTAEAATKLKDTIESFKNLDDKLDSLTKGTLEYKQALLEANEKALELIESNEALQQEGAYEVKNGQIEISEEAMDKALKDSLQKQQDAMLASQAATYEQQKAQQNYDEVEALRDTGGEWDTESGIATALGVVATIAATIAAIPTGGASLAVVPAVTAATLGAATVAGGIYSASTGEDTKTEKEALEGLKEAYKEDASVITDDNMKEWLQENGFDELVDSFDENSVEIRKLITSNAKLEAQNDLLTQQLASVSVEKLYPNISEEYKQVAETIQAEAINSASEAVDSESLIGNLANNDTFLKHAFKLFNDPSKRAATGWYGSNATVTTYDENGEVIKEDKKVSQASISGEIYNGIKSAIIQGDEETVQLFKDLVSKYGSDDEKTEIKNMITAFEGVAETFKNNFAKAQQSGNIIKGIEGFSGTKNQVAFSSLINNLAQSEDNIDFSFLTREQIGELENNKNKFDAEIQKKIEKGIKEYDQKIKQKNKENSKLLNQGQKNADKRSNSLQALGLTEKDAQAYEASLEEVYNISSEYAQAIAEENYAAQEATKSFYETFDKYGDALNNKKEGTVEYAQGIAALQKAYSTWFDAEIDYSTTVEHLEDFKLAIDGDTAAIGRLREAALETLLLDLNLEDSELDELKTDLAVLDSTDISIGATLDDEAVSVVVAKINSLISAGVVDAADMVNILKNKGWETSGTGINEDGLLDSESFKFTGKGEDIVTDTQSSDVADKQKDIAKTARSKKREIVKDRDPLFEEKEAADELIETYDNLTAARDRAYGEDKIEIGKKVVDNIKDQIASNKGLIEQEKQLADAKKNALTDEYGAKFDKNGNMTNYEEIYKKLGDEVIAAYASGDEDAQDLADERFEDFKDNYSIYKDYMDDINDRQEENNELADEGNEILKEQRQYYRDLAQELKELKDAKDFLYEENRAVEDLTKSYDKLSTAKEQAYGVDKMAYGRAERANLQAQKAQNEDNAKKAAKEAGKKRDNLANTYGATFDASGQITNAEAIDTKLRKELAKAQKSGDEEAIDIAEQNLDNWLTDSDGYYSKIDEASDYTVASAENDIAIIQSRLDDIDYVLQLKLEVSDYEMSKIERKLSLLEKGGTIDVATQMSYTAKTAKGYQTKATDSMDAAKQVLRDAGVSETNIEKIISGDSAALEAANLSDAEMIAFKGYVNDAVDYAEQGADTIFQGAEIIAAKYDELFSDLDKASQKVEGYKNQISALGTIGDLIGVSSSDLREISKTLRQGAAEAAKVATATAKARYEGLQTQKKDYEAEIKKYEDISKKRNLTDEEKAFVAVLKEDLKEIDASLPGALAEHYQAVADEIQLANEQFAEQVSEIFNQTMESMWNGQTAEELQTTYDRYKTIQDLYLTEFEKGYQLNKMIRDIQSELDKTSNIGTQKRLNTLLEKANGYYSEDVQLSEKQVKVLQREIEAEKALIALEEGKNKKSKMTLQRNAAGGYGYVYTADQDEINKLEQAYEDSVYNYNKAVDEMISYNESAIVKIQSDWQKALEALDTGAADYKEQMANVNNHYMTLMKYHSGQIDWTLQQTDGFITSHESHMKTAFGNVKDYLKNDWLIDFKDTFVGKNSATATVKEFIGQIETLFGHDANEEKGIQASGMVKSITEAFGSMKQSISNILKDNGLATDISTFKNNVNDIILGKADDKGKRQGGLVDDLGKVKSAVGGINTKFEDLQKVDLTSWASNIVKALTPITETANNAAEAINSLSKKQSNKIANDYKHDDTVRGADDVNLSGQKFKISKGNYQFEDDFEGTDDTSGNLTGTKLGKGITVQATGRTAWKTSSSGKSVYQVFEGTDGNWYRMDKAKAVSKGKSPTYEDPNADKENINPDDIETNDHEQVDTDTDIDVDPGDGDYTDVPPKVPKKPKSPKKKYNFEFLKKNSGLVSKICDIDVGVTRFNPKKGYTKEANFGYSKFGSDGKTTKKHTVILTGYWGKYTKKDKSQVYLYQVWRYRPGGSNIVEGWYTAKALKLTDAKPQSKTSTSLLSKELFILKGRSPSFKGNIWKAGDDLSVGKKYNLKVPRNAFKDAPVYQTKDGKILLKATKKISKDLPKGKYYWIDKNAFHEITTTKSRDEMNFKDPETNEVIKFKNKPLSDVEDFITNYPGLKKSYIPSYIKKLKALGISKYDTGGYTGSWGPEGKMAMLHQKEIVLNAKDTENFLDAIKIVRQIAAQIDLQAAAMSNNSILKAFQDVNLTKIAKNTLDQNVTIHAQFPNVKQHSEIEQALENLINKASQFTNRK